MRCEEFAELCKESWREQFSYLKNKRSDNEEYLINVMEIEKIRSFLKL